MATTMIPDTGAPSPVPAAGLDAVRVVSIRANLLPDEVLVSRRADAVRRRVLTGLGALLVLLVAAYGASWLQTRSANSDLAGVQAKGTSLQSQQQQFAPLVKAQADAQTIKLQLQNLMVGDLAWSKMLVSLRAKAPAGLTLTQVTSTMTAPTAAPAAGASGAAAAPQQAGPGSLNQTGRQQVGTLTITGTARDKKAVADYADRLTTVKGLTSPFITNVTVLNRTATFGMTVIITSDALGGRYAAPTTAAPSVVPSQGGN